MAQTGTNLFRVKEYNEARVLDIIRIRGPVSRREIAEASGLKFQTVSNITNRLREAGVVVEESRVFRGGRRSLRLRLNEEAAYAVGIQLNRSALAVAITDFCGRVLARSSAEVAASEGPSAVVPVIREHAERVIEAAGVLRDKILGAGIGVPGPPTPRTGRMLDPNFLGWREYPLQEELERELGLPVCVDNDATAAALGERWSGVAADAANFVYVYLGSGVGAGIFANHQVYRGSSGNSGEIGHIPVEPHGPPCYCGNRGCLEVYVSPQGVLREARVAALQTSHLPRVARASFPDRFEDVVASEEPLFRSVVEAAGERLGRIISGMVGVLDPELIVLGGPTVEMLGDLFRESILAALRASSLPSRPLPKVELSAAGADAGPVGAAALVLHDTYAPSMQTLSLA
ncbi:ROK family transcriptional regulator [Rubrobacter taiwanensis]|nr:ROK family transcriptional regulator [Rubrobacter taiwanensis]